MEFLTETTLNRFFAHRGKHDCAIITAYRHRINGELVPRRINVANNFKLSKDLEKLSAKYGYGICKCIGQWTESDAQDEEVSEQSYIVCDTQDTKTLYDEMLKLGLRYKQESVYLYEAGVGARCIFTQPESKVNKRKRLAMGLKSPIGAKTPITTEPSKVNNFPKSAASTRIRGVRFRDPIEFTYYDEDGNVIPTPWDYDEMLKTKGITDNFDESKKYTTDFQDLYESYFSRYTAGCFGIGDVIEFNSKILQDQQYKELPPEMRDKVKDMVEASISGDAIVAVAQVDLDGRVSNWYQASTITIAYSQGGGMFYGRVTIPGSLGQYMKRVGDVFSQIPKHAIKQHVSKKEKIEDSVITKAFRTGFVTDLRGQKQKKEA